MLSSRCFFIALIRWCQMLSSCLYLQTHYTFSSNSFWRVLCGVEMYIIFCSHGRMSSSYSGAGGDDNDLIRLSRGEKMARFLDSSYQDFQIVLRWIWHRILNCIGLSVRLPLSLPLTQTLALSSQVLSEVC